jgi:hypothetical protein
MVAFQGMRAAGRWEQRDVLRLTAPSAISSAKIGMLRSEHSAKLSARPDQDLPRPSFVPLGPLGWAAPLLFFGRNSPGASWGFC